VRIAIALLVAASSVAAAEPPRVAYVARALAAVRELGAAGRASLDRALYDASRVRCHADAGPPSASCLVDAATAICAGDRRCEAAADIIVTNLRATNAWVDQATRFRLVRGSADYHAALAAELRRRFAALAAELALAGGGDGAAIDRLCVERDRAVHACRDGDDACVPSVPWSRCVAALVWYVGSSP
jgi:hypothetical protein